MRLSFKDDRFYGGWFYYSTQKNYIYINVEHDSTPDVNLLGEQRIPLDYKVVYSYRNKEFVIHEESEEIILTYSRKSWRKKFNRNRKKTKENPAEPKANDLDAVIFEKGDEEEKDVQVAEAVEVVEEPADDDLDEQ